MLMILLNIGSSEAVVIIVIITGKRKNLMRNLSVLNLYNTIFTISEVTTSNIHLNVTGNGHSKLLLTKVYELMIISIDTTC